MLGDCTTCLGKLWACAFFLDQSPQYIFKAEQFSFIIYQVIE